MAAQAGPVCCYRARRAFDTTVANPGCPTEAQKMQANISPLKREAVPKLGVQIYARSQPLVRRTKRFFAQ
jgi:hypothetical protein